MMNVVESFAFFFSSSFRPLNNWLLCETHKEESRIKGDTCSYQQKIGTEITPPTAQLLSAGETVKDSLCAVVNQGTQNCEDRYPDVADLGKRHDDYAGRNLRCFHLLFFDHGQRETCLTATPD